MKQELYETANIEELCLRATDLIIAAGLDALQKRGRFTLVLTGGSTVRALYKYLVGRASEPSLKRILAGADFFLGDERWVSADHPDSNGGMVRRLLLAPLGIGDNHTFLIPTGGASPGDDAADYEKTLRGFFARDLSGEVDLPQFDLVLLGMGSDGHVASLFQGTGALQEKANWVTTSFPPRLAPAVDRITMTMPVLNRARERVLLVTGREKKAVVRKIMAEPQEAAKFYPAGLLQKGERNVWLLADN